MTCRSSWAILSYLDLSDHTITLWGGARDQVDLQLLYQLVREVGSDRVYVDVPFQYDPPPPFPAQTYPIFNLLVNCINSALSLLSTFV